MSSTPPPATTPDPGEGLALVMPGRSVSYGAALSWIPRSWVLFRKAPLMWILAVLIFVVVGLIVQMAPIIGSIALSMVQPIYFAGFAVACRRLELGEDFEIEHVFAGFKTRSTDLLIVGVITTVASYAFMAIWVMMFIGIAGWGMIAAIGAAIMANNPNLAAELITHMWLPFTLVTLIILLLFIPLLAAYWFAPFLVLMNGLKPVPAMKASLMGCIRNFFQMAVYGIAMLGLMILVSLLGAIPILASMPVIVSILAVLVAAVAMVVLCMMSITAIYTTYRDIFTEEVSRPAASMVTL